MFDVSERMIALVDCESFYASCERVFHPKLAGKPIVVLSNNDGCVVAANSEAKQRGVVMGVPWFKLEAWAVSTGVVARSSNYELYGSLSARVMETIGEFAAWQEVYSIDESFIGMRGTVDELTALGADIRAEVLKRTKIPVRVGIGKTKTLAKLASRGAKQNLALGGVCHLGAYEPERLDRIMAATHVTELWGVAGRLGKRLAGMGIHTVKDLRDADPTRIRKRFGVVLQRTVFELNGVACIPLDQETATKEQLIFSRSFSRPVTTAQELQQVLGIYAQRVAGRLRAQGSVAKNMNVWAATSHYEQGERHYPNISVVLPAPTDEPVTLVKAANALLPHIRHGLRYVRAGVVLTGLSAKTAVTPFDVFVAGWEERKIGETLDQITRKTGANAIGIGRAGLRDAPGWNMRREMLSPRATTHWEEISEVRA